MGVRDEIRDSLRLGIGAHAFEIIRLTKQRAADAEKYIRAFNSAFIFLSVFPDEELSSVFVVHSVNQSVENFVNLDRPALINEMNQSLNQHLSDKCRR